MAGLIRDEDINEVRERNDLIEIISGYVALKKTGRTFKGLCPFHKEKTPSFIVDPVKQLYHCFGCQDGGNVFTFVMKMDNLTFPEAVKTLAERANYPISFDSYEETRQVSEKPRLFQANNLAM